MKEIDGSLGGNILLDFLAPECRDFLRSRMLTKPIVAGEVLYQPDMPLLNLVFPHDGLVSLQCLLSDGRTVEKMSVGIDGLIGVEFLLGENRFSSQAVTVISGRASWLPVGVFAAAHAQFSCIQPVLAGYAIRQFRQLMQSVVCASVHLANQRIATWLLHARDRSKAKKFDITQRTLADILGLRIATVSEACNRLRLAGAIHYSRGIMNILDGTFLEAEACECYEAVRLSRHLSSRSPMEFW